MLLRTGSSIVESKDNLRFWQYCPKLLRDMLPATISGQSAFWYFDVFCNIHHPHPIHPHSPIIQLRASHPNHWDARTSFYTRAHWDSSWGQDPTSPTLQRSPWGRERRGKHPWCSQGLDDAGAKIGRTRAHTHARAHVCIYIYVCVCVCVCLFFFHLFIYLLIYLSIYLSIYLCFYFFIYLLIYLCT